MAMEESISEDTWFLLVVMILVPGLAANLLLAWILLRDPKDLSPSKALGLQLVLTQLLFITATPVGLSLRMVYNEEANLTMGNDTHAHRIHWAAAIDDGVYIFILVSTPLLLAAMCVERFLAAAWPVLYLRARHWRCKLPVLAAVWLATAGFLVPTVLLGFARVISYLLFFITIVFLVMLSSLAGVAWSLWLQSPAHSSAPPQASPPLKRRALWNILAVIVPAVCAYLPLLFYIPSSTLCMADRGRCNSLNSVILLFPLLGLFIGPLFYRAKVQQVLCVGGVGRPRPG